MPDQTCLSGIFTAESVVRCMDKSWHQSLGGFVWGITRFIWAPFMVIGVPILAVYGALHASEADLLALQLRPTQIPLLIGTAGDGNDCSKYTPCSSVGQRTYLVFPEALLRGELAMVNHKDDVVTVDRRAFLGYIVISIWTACVVLTWRYCVRPWLSAFNSRLPRSRRASSLGQGRDR
jgi:hypothetical protein